MIGMTDKTSALTAVTAPVFALEAMRDGVFLAWNDALSTMVGLSAANVIGRTPADVFGASAATLALSPPGIVHIPKVGLAVVERQDGILIGTAQDRDREAFISMAAHDLRAPLRNVLILAEMAIAEGGHDRDLIAKITNVARSGLSLTKDVVGAAQALAQGEQKKTVVSLREMASQIMTSLDCEVAIDCPDVKVLVEKPVLMIALHNLMDNAVRHGNARRQIRIEADQSQLGLRVRVLDNGTGFKDSSLAFLAGGEFRLESGYGLFGLRRLLQARGGRVTVEPAETGKGSAVVVTLPGGIEGDRVAIAS